MYLKLGRWLVIKLLYPFFMLLGAFSEEKKESYLRVFVELNNKLVRKEKPKAKKMLLLLPHCIQASSCDIRLTFNVLNCKRCGKCEIKDLIQIAEERDLSVFIAAGGSQARRIIKDIKPESVIAAACENDLSSGIVDTYPLPVLGILNERPFGPCLDTRVDLEKVKEAIEFFSSN